MTVNPKQWDWYGTWLIDFICTEDSWDALEIWEDAYRDSLGDLVEDVELIDLVDFHQREAFEPIEKSFVWAIVGLLHDCSIPFAWFQMRCLRLARIRTILRWENEQREWRKPRNLLQLILSDF